MLYIVIFDLATPLFNLFFQVTCGRIPWLWGLCFVFVIKIKISIPSSANCVPFQLITMNVVNGLLEKMILYNQGSMSCSSIWSWLRKVGTDLLLVLAAAKAIHLANCFFQHMSKEKGIAAFAFSSVNLYTIYQYY